jgi:NAD(P)-dependent dehydrogenase (short-subunit alcohol dehydrogenase family)
VPSILITGVSSGLGKALASHASREGWRVFGTTRDDRPSGEHDLPDGVTLVRLELRFPHAVSTFSERFLAEFGAPDVLVNNAARAVYGPAEELSAESLAELFQVNVLSPIGLINAMLPAMRTRGSGTIVNVTSLGGKMTFPFFTAYNATKHALEGFSEGLWHELRPLGIRVKIVEPGFVDTPIYRVMEAQRQPTGPYAEGLRAINALQAGIRKRTSPEEAAAAVWKAILDPSRRLRYPVAAHARSLLRLRRLLGDEAFIRALHARWFKSPT